MRLLISSHFPFNKIGYSKQTKEIVKSILKLCPNIEIGIICWDGWDLPVENKSYNILEFIINSTINSDEYEIFKNVKYFSGGKRKLDINNQDEITKHWQIIKRYVDFFKADKLLIYQDIWIFETFDIQAINCEKYIYLPIHNDFTSHNLVRHINGVNPEIKTLQFLPYFKKIATFSKFGIEVLKKYQYKNSVFINHIINVPTIKNSKLDLRTKYNLGHNIFICLIIGRNGENTDRKSFITQFEAFGQFQKDKNDCKLIFHDSYTSDLTSGAINLKPIVEKFKMNDKIIVTGNSIHTDEHIAELYGLSDVLLCASKSEGFGIPMVEAQFHNLKVISNNCTAMNDNTSYGVCLEPSQVSNTINGINSWSHADPDKIAKTLNDFYNNDLEKYNLKPIDKSKYSSDIIGKKWVDFLELENCIEKKSSIKLKNDKYIVFKGWNGLGDRLTSLALTIEYSKKTGRILVVDWNDNEWADEFDKYFELDNVKYMKNIEFKKIYETCRLSIVPKFWNGKLTKYNIHTMGYELLLNDDDDNNNNNTKLISIISNKVSDFNEDIVVFTSAGIRKNEHLYNLKCLKFTKLVSEYIQNDNMLKLLDNNTLTVHLRGNCRIPFNNDNYSNYVDKMSNKINLFLKENSKIEKILLVTDDINLIDMIKANIKTNQEILFRNDLIDTNKNDLHRLSKDELEKYNLTKFDINLNTIRDIYLLSQSKYLIHGNSYFSYIAARLKEYNHNLNKVPEKKYIIFKGCTGFGDRLSTFIQAIEYSKKTGRILVVDWNDEIFDHDFYNYFNLDLKNVLTINEFKSIIKQKSLSYYPKMWNNTNIFTFKYSNPLDTMLLNFNDKDNKLLWNNDIVNILFDKRLDFSEDILVYVGFGKRAATLYLNNLKLITFNNHMIKCIKNNYIFNKLNNCEYICVHLRGTDKLVLNNETYDKYVQKMIEKFNNSIKNSHLKKLLILSDDPKLRDLFIEKIHKHDFEIFFNPKTQQSNGIHHIKKDKNNENIKYRLNIDMLIDFYLLTSSKILIIDNDSWFSKMANHIKNLGHKLVNIPKSNYKTLTNKLETHEKTHLCKKIKILIPKNHQEIFDWEKKMDNLYNLVVVLPNFNSKGNKNLWTYKITSKKILKVDLKLKKIYNEQYYYYTIYKELSKLLKNYYNKIDMKISNYNVILMDNSELGLLDFFEMKFIKFFGIKNYQYKIKNNIEKRTFYELGKNIFENHISRLHCKYQNIKLRKIKPISECKLNALLIDNRCNINLETQLLNTIHFTDDDVGFQIMTTPENKSNIEKVIEKYNLENIVLTVVNFNPENISQFLFSREFYENVNLYKVFIYQFDSLLLKTLDKKYYKYDWIGAPWQKINLNQYNLDKNIIPVGNGGFNIRNIYLCRKIAHKFNYNIENACKKLNYNYVLAEDIVYSYYLQSDCDIDANIPDINIAKYFSSEDPVDLNYEMIGFHNAYSYLQNNRSIELFDSILNIHYNSIENTNIKKNIQLSIQNSKKRKLIYSCVFFNREYIKLLELLTISLSLYGSIDINTDYLVICSPNFEEDIKKLFLKCNIKVKIWKLDLNSNFEACCSRLKIFNYTEINLYDKILYLDCDILVTDKLNNILDLKIDNKLYALKEGTTSIEAWGNSLFKNKIDIAAFTSGIMLFTNSYEIRKLFKTINKHINDHLDKNLSIPCCQDQPFIVYNAISSNLYNNELLIGKVINMPKYFNGETISHFPGGGGTGWGINIKYKIMHKYLFNFKSKLSTPRLNLICKTKIQPPKNSTFPLVGMCISYNYMDTLKFMLPINSRHFEKIYIITQNDDSQTVEYCKKFNNVEVLLYNFKNNGKIFDKFGALNMVQKIVYSNHPNSWYLIIDSDIILPNNFIDILENENLQEDCIYGALRNNFLKSSELLKEIKPDHKFLYNDILAFRTQTSDNPPSIMGCFQLYKKQCYQNIDFKDAGFGDYIFCHKNFDKFCNLENIVYLHLGEIGKNWKGKIYNFIDDVNIKIEDIYFNCEIKSKNNYYNKNRNIIQYKGNDTMDIFDDVWTCSNCFRNDIEVFFKNKSEYKISEIGSHKGYTTRFLSYIFKKVYAIDNSIEWTNCNKNYNKDRDNIEYINLNIYKNAWNIIPDSDVVFIDAMHGYNECKSDIINSLKQFPNLKYIIFDDYGVWNGVKKVVDEFLSNQILLFEKFIGLNNVPGPNNSVIKNIAEGIICKINPLLNTKFYWGNGLIEFKSNRRMLAFGDGRYEFIGNNIVKCIFGGRIHILKFDNNFNNYLSIRMDDLAIVKGNLMNDVNYRKSINVFYRISDKGRRDGKPNYITLENCLNNFLKHFKNENIIFIADNCEKVTINMINNLVQDAKIIQTKLGNSGSFLFTLDKILTINYHDNSIIYLIEDDYLHLENSANVLREGLNEADYVTLYDHPDKYGDNSVNPLVKNGGENTKVFKTKSSYWKLTNSTTMTFAVKFKTLKEDYSTIIKYLKNKIPQDYVMFRDLIINKSRKLASCIPGLSTHGQNPCLSPLVEWDKVVKKNLNIVIIACHTYSELKLETILNNIKYFKDNCNVIYLINSQEYKGELEKYLNNDYINKYFNLNNNNPKLKEIKIQYYKNTRLLCHEKWFKCLETIKYESNKICLTNDSFLIVNSIDRMFKSTSDMFSILSSNEGTYHYPDFLRVYNKIGIKKWKEYYLNNIYKCNEHADLVEIMEIRSSNMNLNKDSLFKFPDSYKGNIHFDDINLKKVLNQDKYPIIKLKRILNCNLYKTEFKNIPDDFDANIYRNLNSKYNHYTDNELKKHFIELGQKMNLSYKYNQKRIIPEFIKKNLSKKFIKLLEPNYKFADKLGFIITRCVINYKSGKYFISCYNQIRKFYPEAPIIFIDDYSNYKFIDVEFEKKMYKTRIIKSFSKGAAELLAYSYYVKNPYFETAVFLHDSCFINKLIDFNTKSCEAIWTFQHKSNNNIEYSTQMIIKNNHELNTLGKKYIENMKIFTKIIDKNDNLLKYFNSSFYLHGIFGNLVSIKYEFLKKIYEKYDLDKLLPFIKCRASRMWLERIIPMVIENVGNFKIKSILGNIHNYSNLNSTDKNVYKWLEEYSDNIIEKYPDIPLIKVWSGR